jgi:predicted RNase H-like HicB family nuclease
MTYSIEIDRETDGRWIAEVPDLPGVLAYGATRVEATARVQALALRVVADRLEAGSQGSQAAPDGQTLDTLEWSSNHPCAAGTKFRGRPMLRREISQPVILGTTESLLPVAAEPMALVGGVNAAADAAQVRRGRLRLPSKRSSPPQVRLLRSSGSVEGGSSRPPMRPT